MIELIYNEEEKHTTEEACLRVPKNSKKVGNPPEYKKIFIEKSVKDFLHQYSTEQKFVVRMAILLGMTEKKAGIRHLYIKGSLPIDTIAENQGMYYFPESLWTDIYRQCAQYFDGLEICGWALAKPGMGLEHSRTVEETQRTYFSGADKLLFLMEPLSGECGFFGFDGNRFVKQQGYYIYESKNQWMEKFLLDQKSSGASEERAVGEATVRFRTLLQTREKEYQTGRRTVHRRRKSPAAAVLAVLVLLVIGSSAERLFALGKKIWKPEIKQEVSREVSADGVIVEELDSGLEPKEEGDKEVQRPEITQTPEEQITETVNPTPKETATPTPKETASPTPAEVAKATEPPLPEPEKAESAYVEYTIREGDSLVKIIREHYGNLNMLEKICELNGILDQDHVQIGETILLP